MSDASLAVVFDFENPDQELAARVSHHIRNPIVAIKWSSEMLLDGDAGELTAEQQEHVRAIAASNQRLRELAEALVTALDAATKPATPD
jgi:signal transduction histidine kinase